MSKSISLLLAGLLAAGTQVACLRSYNASPVTPATLATEGKIVEALVLGTHAFTRAEEIQDKFGEKLAQERQVIPVQVQLANQGTRTWKVTRLSFALVQDANAQVRLETLNQEDIYQLGRHGWGKPVCGMILGGVLGIPSAVTTSTANDRLRADYLQKALPEMVLEPGKDVHGVVFFDPASRLLGRNDKFKLVLELQDAKTGEKARHEQPLA